MTEETFFEHCLRRIRAGDHYSELISLVRKANRFHKLEVSTTKSESSPDHAARAKRGWDTRRRKQEQKELEAKAEAIPAENPFYRKEKAGSTQ